MNFVVKVTPEISEALQKTAFKNGYVWTNSKAKYIGYVNYNYLYFLLNKKTVACNDNLMFVGSSGNKYTQVSIDEAVKLLSQEQIMIGQYPVEFTAEGVKVGCQTISTETVEKIYNKLKGK